MQDIEKLVAIETIKQQFHRRIRYMDTKQWHLYADVHTPHASS